MKISYNAVFLALIINAFFCNVANADDFIKCSNNTTLESCVINQANKPDGDYDKFFAIETLSVGEKYTIVNAFTRLSAYNSFSAIFLFDKKSNYLFPLTYDQTNRFGFVDFYADGLTFSAQHKFRGLGDIGIAEFYKIDVNTKTLNRLVKFVTDEVQSSDGLSAPEQYKDEDGKPDKSLGYWERFEKYKKDHKLKKLKLVEIYHSKGEEK